MEAIKFNVKAAEIATDRLGDIKAEMVELRKEAKVCEAIVIAADEKVTLGKKYRAVVSKYTRFTIDYKAICARIKVSKYFTDTYRKVTDVTAVKVNAHKK